MKKQMQRIAVILLAILLMIVYGSKPLSDLGISLDAVFILLGIGGMLWMYLVATSDSDGS
ncbi:hypothetical protein H6B33_05945 [Gemmiger formicilis]|uniref:hypothetical protein n=1 Tax=Gemmiger formicilis TaxID=745368 RepID=UPI0019561EE3|nr:hypothetical protein [Gemmiger formicilis]MBM6914945.1 hypothetical protein [Gemmiger formicilis]